MIKVIIKETKSTSKLEEVLMKYKDKLLQYGYDISNRKTLGKGTMGIAYLINDNKVLKLTTDESEANSSTVIMGQPTKHLARIEKVFKLGNTGFYIIIMENLQQISQEEMDFWNMLSDSYILDKLMIGKPKSWRELKPKLADAWDNYARDNEDELQLQDFLNKARQYNFPEMIDELAKYGILFYDFHGENIMKRGNDSVIIDLGYSKAKQKDVLVIEKKKQ